jgi:hypothetical protein
MANSVRRTLRRTSLEGRRLRRCSGQSAAGSEALHIDTTLHVISTNPSDRRSNCSSYSSNGSLRSSLAMESSSGGQST